MTLDAVVGLRHGSTNDDRENEGDDAVTAVPDAHVNGLEHGDKREAPSKTVNNRALSVGEELVDNESKQEHVDGAPDVPRPPGGRNVGIAAVVVPAPVRAIECANIEAEEENIRQYVHNLYNKESG